MKIARNVLLTRRTLFAQKLRTLLALIGITIGVAAVSYTHLRAHETT